MLKVQNTHHCKVGDTHGKHYGKLWEKLKAVRNINTAEKKSISPATEYSENFGFF